MAWHNVCDEIRKYVVKVETPEGSGTGFFFAYNESKSLVGIATALHVVEHAEDWREAIRIVQGDKELYLNYSDRVVQVDYKRDSAVILVRAPDLEGRKFEVLAAMLTVLQSNMQMKVGVNLGWGGFPAIAPRTLCFFQGGVSAFNSDDDSYFLDGVAINGVSGGPVFSSVENKGEPDRPQIVGIVSAYYVNRQRGDALPGLAMVHDATHLNASIERVKNLDEARKKEEEAKKHRETEGVAQQQGPQQGPKEPAKS